MVACGAGRRGGRLCLGSAVIWWWFVVLDFVGVLWWWWFVADFSGGGRWFGLGVVEKEAFRKYLESSGVLDALTKVIFPLTVVLVSLYEQSDKPSSAIAFIKQKLGGPTIAEYEKLQAEISDLQIRYNELLSAHQEKCRESHYPTFPLLSLSPRPP